MVITRLKQTSTCLNKRLLIASKWPPVINYWVPNLKKIYIYIYFLKNLVSKINLEDMHCLNRHPVVSKQVSTSLKQARACFETSVCLFWDRCQPNLKQVPTCFEQVFRCSGKLLFEAYRCLSLNRLSSIW